MSSDINPASDTKSGFGYHYLASELSVPASDTNISALRTFDGVTWHSVTLIHTASSKYYHVVYNACIRLRPNTLINSYKTLTYTGKEQNKINESNIYHIIDI